MKRLLSRFHPLALFLLLAPAFTLAQDRGGLDLAQIDGGTMPLAAAPPDTPPGLPTAPSPAHGTPAAAPAAGTIKLNFQNAELSAVLNYLSSAAGFIITQEVPVTGTVNVVSQQPMTPDEAVDLLNTILDSKGYVAIRNGRILKIVSRTTAATHDLPVVTGADPAAIPRKDNMVTQILPVRYVPVGKLVENLHPLLSADASISSNDSSNAVILTDTQANIHRMAEIIRALDTSVSSISVIRVYTLRYADAKELADVITQLFAPSSSSNNNNNNQRGGGGFGGFPFFGGGFGRGGQQQQQSTQPDSAAMQAASRVVAVADETTNSVVVSAPDEYLSAISDIVEKLDTNTTEVTETQIFKLLHADATELAASLTALYSDSTTANNAGGGNNRGGGNNNNRGGQPNGGSTSGQSDRALQQARVIAVADPRTNSVLVNASHASIAQIALLVGRLDASDSKKQHIFVHTLAHADPSNVAYILNGMFSVSSTNNSSTAQQPTDSRLLTRSAQGLTTDAQNSIGSGSSSSSGNRSSSSSSGLR